MDIGRDILLWASRNEWMKNSIPNYPFVKKAMKRFMPGEKIEDALREAQKFNELGIGTVFTHLGENLKNLHEAEEVTFHYIEALKKIETAQTPTEISIKLTQLGFDLSVDQTMSNFEKILNQAKDKNNFVWIDIEQSSYVDATLQFYKRFKKLSSNVGLCLQSYLIRTKNDLIDLLDLSPNIRLVKGAYKEPHHIAFKEKSKVDENYFELSKLLLEAVKSKNCRAAFATHDLRLISMIEAFGKANGFQREQLEFQMLYGIKTSEQIKLAKEGYKILVLISYGSSWYPWYMRRLAERPANVGFVLKNLFTN
jgi:proline dehydrogenase